MAGNIDGFDAQLQSVKIPLSIFFNCIANTGYLRDYPSIFSLSNFALYSRWIGKQKII